jgi:hypothetical protein
MTSCQVGQSARKNTLQKREKKKKNTCLCDADATKARCVVEGRRPLSCVDVGTLLAQIVHHLNSAERGGPIEKRLANLVSVIDVDLQCQCK